MLYKNNKDLLGIFFLVLSVLFLGYLLVTPLNHLVCQIDEYFTRTILLLPVSDIITVTAGDVHPPLYYLMGKAVAELSKVLGVDLLYSLKLLSIAAYVLILGISVTKIRKDYGLFTAGLFPFAIAIMNEFSKYVLIGRMYCWVVLFVLIIFLAFRNIINNKSDIKSWIIMALFTIVAAYTHYFAAMTAACIYLVLLIYLIKNNKEHIKYWLISVAVIVVSYLPWVPHLLSQMAHVHNGYWIPEITWESALLFYGYYGYNENVLIAILSLVILAAIIFMYMKEKSSFEKTDQNLILSGIAVYLGTITLGVLISFLFKPILDGRYLMAASSVLWLTIAIIISKLENKKMFYLSLALVAILLISGVANTVNTYDENYQKAIIQENYFNNITSDNNSVLIISTTNDSTYFLSYSDRVDLYILNVSEVFGLDMERIHQTFDFKNVNASKIDDFIVEHPDKNIYLISWKEPKINSSYEVINQDVFLYFTKINETSKNV